MAIQQQEAGSSEERFDRYIQGLTQVIGHADRAEPLRAYCTGLLLPGERKSVEPMAAKIEPARVSNRHQSMHHFVADAPWSDRELLAEVRRYALPALVEHGGVESWMVDDTGHPKKGTHSVGVAKQYCGQLGKTENCQVAVSLSLANQSASLPVAYRLFLPEVWAKDMERRGKAGVPKEVVFQKKTEIALAQIRAAVTAGIPTGVVDADAGYGNDTTFRDEITALGLRYAVGVQSTTSVWVNGTGPLPPAPYSGRGQVPKLLRRDAEHTPVSLKEVALSLPEGRFRKVTWREGAKGAQHSRFAVVRVRPAHRDYQRTEPRPEEWLIIEWPAGEKEPTKYWLSTLPKRTTVKHLVATIKLRWRIERDYQELKDEIGLGHFEGRGWRGFHHHASLAIAAYAFLVAERGRFSPSGVGATPRLPVAPVPGGFRPRGAPDATRAAQPDLDREHANAHHRGTHHATSTLSVLSPTRQTTAADSGKRTRQPGSGGA